MRESFFIAPRRETFGSWARAALGSALLCAGRLFAEPSGLGDSPVEYNRDIRPILSKNCFSCHGQDDKSRRAMLRLDRRDNAVGKGESGKLAIVPGSPDASELIARVATADADLRMPPHETGTPLTKESVETLRRWVAQGASYQEHWAYVRPTRQPFPNVKASAWPSNGVDRFLLAKMEQLGLSPAPRAAKGTLLRRLSLDLRGLPPTPRELAEFESDTSPDAYEKWVDRFLADPAYGERWASMWLDLARYADSAGYGSDPLRTIWRYRDWVIDAFNRNLPYDQFSKEQLAGDLLNNPSNEQLLATAFHRNTMTNTEGGTDDEEFRVVAVKDRVDTTLQVWMGLTMGCAKCHSHKYDPITQKEYYQFYAMFNQTADADRGDESPLLTTPTKEELAESKRIEARVSELKIVLATTTPALIAAQKEWENVLVRAKGQKPVEPPKVAFVRIEAPGKQRWLSLAEVQVFVGAENVAGKGTAQQISVDYEGPAKLAIDGNTDGRFFVAKSTTHTTLTDDPWWEVKLAQPAKIDRVAVWNRLDGTEDRLAGYRILALGADRQVLWRKDSLPAPKPSATFDVQVGETGPRAQVPSNILAMVDTPTQKRTAEQAKGLADYYRGIAPALQGARDELARLEKSKPVFAMAPMMQELPANQRRATHIMEKGNFKQLGEKVEPGTPAAFPPLPKNAPQNRLGVADWLFDPQNPLTARVAVNRFWAQLFGVGLVITEEDFGVQGELPSHPELLDWLACEFREQGWDMKRLLKLLVMSSAYRQMSEVTKEKLAKDPTNRWLARAPRVRLSAEMVRDQALSLAGLLSRKSHGPSVFPPQPDGLWQAAFNGQRTWATSVGEDRYRRGLYTFWRRTVPYPSMATFDATSREVCAIRRIRTNTPLQSFVTLNDPVFVEAAQGFGRRIVREGGANVADRLRFAIRLGLCREPRPGEIATLTTLLDQQLKRYRADLASAKAIATEPLALPADAKNVDFAELAAWTSVASVLLNLDALLMKG